MGLLEYMHTDGWKVSVVVELRNVRMALQSDTVQCGGHIVVNIFVMHINTPYIAVLFFLWS